MMRMGASAAPNMGLLPSSPGARTSAGSTGLGGVPCVGERDATTVAEIGLRGA
jgi:hypothetical protein